MQIVVDHVVVVQELHGGEELARELDDQPLLHRLPEHRRQRVVAPLEREIEEVLLLERVEDVDDVRVPEREEPAAPRAPTRLAPRHTDGSRAAPS